MRSAARRASVSSFGSQSVTQNNTVVMSSAAGWSEIGEVPDSPPPNDLARALIWPTRESAFSAAVLQHVFHRETERHAAGCTPHRCLVQSRWPVRHCCCRYKEQTLAQTQASFRRGRVCTNVIPNQCSPAAAAIAGRPKLMQSCRHTKLPNAYCCLGGLRLVIFGRLTGGFGG